MKYNHLYQVKEKFYCSGKTKSCHQCLFYRSYEKEGRKRESCMVSLKEKNLPEYFKDKNAEYICDELMSLIEIEKPNEKEILEYKINKKYINLNKMILED
ncbi:MAG: hypothetical protein ACRCW9_06035 [Cetobacterium sp.]